MFDYIKFETKCPNCKTKVDDFQSKDGACMLSELNFWEVDNFYTSCNKCETWIEYNLGRRPNRKITIKDYKIEVKIRGRKFAKDNKEEKNNG